jgi:hypothetical protein
MKSEKYTVVVTTVVRSVDSQTVGLSEETPPQVVLVQRPLLKQPESPFSETMIAWGKAKPHHGLMFQ